MASIVYPVACSHTDFKHLACVSALVGIVSHVTVATSHIEFERYIFHSITLAIALCVGDFVLASEHGDCNYVGAFVHLVINVLGFSAGVFVSLIIYRVFFHRCKHFPGPPVAKFSRFYAAYLNAGESQFYKELKTLHGRYGDYVRMGKFYLGDTS